MGDVVSLSPRPETPDELEELIVEAWTWIEWGDDHLDDTRYIKALLTRLATALERRA